MANSFWNTRVLTRASQLAGRLAAGLLLCLAAPSLGLAACAAPVTVPIMPIKADLPAWDWAAALRMYNASLGRPTPAQCALYSGGMGMRAPYCCKQPKAEICNRWLPPGQLIQSSRMLNLAPLSMIFDSSDWEIYKRLHMGRPVLLHMRPQSVSLDTRAKPASQSREQYVLLKAMSYQPDRTGKCQPMAQIVDPLGKMPASLPWASLIPQLAGAYSQPLPKMENPDQPAPDGLEDIMILE